MEIAELLKMLAWTTMAGIVALALDSALLAAEDRGWIYYRTRRGGSTYFLNELNEMLGGGKAPEIREEIQQAESRDTRGGRDSE